MDTSVRKLLNAIVLSAINKGAHTIRMTQQPLAVHFDYEEYSDEEMRPPPKLRWALTQELSAMSGARLEAPAELTMFVGEHKEHCYGLRVQLSRGPEVFRIGLTRVVQ